jgi:hypothetical protein
MHYQALQQAAQLVRPGIVECAQWQNDQVHDQIDRNAKKDAADGPVVVEEAELTAGEAIDCCG